MTETAKPVDPMEQKTLALTFPSLVSIFESRGRKTSTEDHRQDIDHRKTCFDDLTIEQILFVNFYRYPLLAAPVSLVLLPLPLGRVASQAGQGVSVLASSLTQQTEYTHRMTLMATNSS